MAIPNPDPTVTLLDMSTGIFGLFERVFSREWALFLVAPILAIALVTEGDPVDRTKFGNPQPPAFKKRSWFFVLTCEELPMILMALTMWPIVWGAGKLGFEY